MSREQMVITAEALIREKKRADAAEQKLEEITASIDWLLEIIDKQLAHQGKQEPTHYSRGFVKGIEWTKTEIMKVFER